MSLASNFPAVTSHISQHTRAPGQLTALSVQGIVQLQQTLRQDMLLSLLVRQLRLPAASRAAATPDDVTARTSGRTELASVAPKGSPNHGSRRRCPSLGAALVRRTTPVRPPARASETFLAAPIGGRQGRRRGRRWGGPSWPAALPPSLDPAAAALSAASLLPRALRRRRRQALSGALAVAFLAHQAEQVLLQAPAQVRGSGGLASRSRK